MRDMMKTRFVMTGSLATERGLRTQAIYCSVAEVKDDLAVIWSG